MKYYRRLRWMLRHPGCNWKCAKWPSLCWHLRPEQVEALNKALNAADRIKRKLPPRD